MRWPVALFLGWLVLGIDAGLSIHLSPGGGGGLRVSPSFTIPFLVYIALNARVTRASVLEAMAQDWVLTARAKGLTRREVLWRHILPNALIPVATVIGYNFGYSLTGAIMVETVFAWPGLGQLFITSIGNRDYPVLQGIFLFTAVVGVLANVATDVLYAFLYPRVRQHYVWKA